MIHLMKPYAHWIREFAGLGRRFGSPNHRPGHEHGASRVGRELDGEGDDPRLAQFAIERSGDAAFWIRRDASFCYVNEAACRSLGYERRELLNLRVPDVDPNFAHCLWPQQWEQVKRQGAFSFEAYHRKKNGDIFPVEITVNYVEFAGEEYNCAFARDTSERRRAERQLHLTQFAIDRANDGVLWVAPEGSLRYVNDAACSMLGYTRSELLAMSIGDIDPAYPLEEWQDQWERLRQVGSADFETTHRKKDGTLFSVWITCRHLEYEGQEYNYAIVRDLTERKQAEEQLRFTQFAMDRVNDAAFWLGPDARFFYVNDAACTSLGYSRDELLSLTVHDVSGGSVVEEWSAEWRRIKNERFLSFESHHRRKNGTTFPVELRINYMEFEGREFCCTFARDITERKRAEERLRFTQFAIDRAGDAAFWAGHDAILFYVNDAACESLGYSEAELLNLRVHDINPDFTEEIWLARWEELKSAGSFKFEGRHRRKDATTFPVEVTVNYVEFEGKEYGCTFARDISERKHAEEQLLLTQFSVDRAGDAVYWIALPDVNFIYANDAACRGLGYSRDELLTMRVQDIDPNFRPEVFLDQKDEIAKAGGFSFESQHRRKDGTLFPVEITLNYLEFEGGDLVSGQYCCAFCRDISERKRAEEEKRRMEVQIQQAQKLESLGLLAGGIAHDFNNLLTGILGNASLAQMDISSGASASDKIQQIERAALRAADLTQQMLAYSGKGRFVVEPIDLNRLVHDMTLVETVISKKAVVEYDLREPLPAVEVDTTQIRQVIMNLMTNASDALGEEAGTIRVCTGVMEANRDYLTETYLNERLPEGKYVYLEVADTGVGMDEETVSKIFDPFFTTKFAGRGLGLAAVLGIVRGHHGAIKIDSKVGRGTTIRLLLPPTDRAVRKATEEAGNAQDWRGSGTILVVDDEETVRAFAKSMLTSVGFDVLTARDGQEGVQIFQNHVQDITGVLLDLTMPGLDGEAALSEIRRVDPEAKVIMMSGFNEEDVVVSRISDEGLAGFVHKPFRPQDLVAMLRDVLR